MTAYQLELNVSTEQDQSLCGDIGGTPHFPTSTDWPRCRLCELEMVLFLELTLPDCDTTPFKAESRLQIFACREHDDIAGTIYSDYTQFISASNNRMLPTDYWNLTDGHYFLRLLPPSEQVYKSQQETRLIPQFIAAIATTKEAEDGFKLFGKPKWLQKPECHNCSCGAPMQLLLQIPENYSFLMAEGAPKQPNSYSGQYMLFLGNQLYLLACINQCDPKALWPVLQN